MSFLRQNRPTGSVGAKTIRETISFRCRGWPKIDPDRSMLTPKDNYIDYQVLEIVFLNGISFINLIEVIMQQLRSIGNSDSPSVFACIRNFITKDMKIIDDKNVILLYNIIANHVVQFCRWL